MKMKIQLFRNKRTGSMRAYVDSSGTVYLNVDDVAHGLGFTYNDRNGTSFADLDVINNHLKEFDYPTAVRLTDFIPENMFYLLAMKANNEAAKNFQVWLAADVIPSIRKTGKYQVKDARQQHMRALSIDNSKNETSAIKEYISHIRQHGDYRPEGLIYATFSNKANMIAGIPKGGRDDASAEQLSALILSESIIRNRILHAIDNGFSSRKTEYLIDSDLNVFGLSVKRLL